jgi:hypothetical protein
VTGGACKSSLVTGGSSKYSLVTGGPASIFTCAMAGRETIMTNARYIAAKSNLFKNFPPFSIIHYGVSSALLMSEKIPNRLLILS